MPAKLRGKELKRPAKQSKRPFPAIKFRRTRPSMSQCILAWQIDFPAIGLAPKAQRHLAKLLRPLSLETGGFVDYSPENG